MLPASHRLSRGADLRRVSRSGARGSSATLVAHLVIPDVSPDGAAGAAAPTRIGFVVSRAVGNAVTRHHVQRRLRHLCRERLSALPAGSELVVRALAPAAAATYQELGADLDRCLRRALRSSAGTVS